MSAARYKGWRFLHPSLDTGVPHPGLSIDNRGKIAMVEGAGAVRQAVLLLLSTRPGERIMRPSYGCHLHRLVFAPNDYTSAGLAIHYVQQALQQWEPRVDVLHLDAAADPTAPSLMNVFLTYRVRSTLQVEHLIYPFEL